MMIDSFTPLFSQYEDLNLYPVHHSLRTLHYRSHLKLSANIPKKILQKKIVFGRTAPSSL